MDQRMLNAAYTGDTTILHQLLQENPFILSDYAIFNPLTVATKANQPVFAREILKLKPDLATEPNQDGLRPLDVASAYGNLEIVRELLVAGPEICRLAGRDGMTAVHYAAQNGRVEIIDQLRKACPECVNDVTSFGETALHLAVKFFKFEVLRSLLQWLENGGLMEVVNLGDKEGNTVLHYAVSRKQLVSVELLLDWSKLAGNNKLDVNAVNGKGLTPTDITDILLESSSDIHLREILHRAGGYGSSQIQVVSDDRPNLNPNTNQSTRVEKPKNWEDVLKHFEFQWHRDSPGEARETLLLIAALIATVTFQAGITPPSYLFEPSQRNVTVTDNDGADVTSTRFVWTRSVASFTVFMVANSVALSTAVSIVDYLTVGLPFQRELRVSICAMVFAYSWSMGNTKPTGTVKSVLLGVAIAMPLFLRVLPFMVSELRKRNRRTSA